MAQFLQIIVSGILLGGIYSLISIGLTLIFGIVKVINFAHGEFLMIAMYLAFWSVTLLNMDPYVSLILVVPAMFVLGVLTQKIVINPILKAPDAMQIFATVGVGIVLQNIALFLWKADYRTILTPYQDINFALGPIVFSFTRLTTFVLAMLVSIGFFYYLKRSYTGKALRSVSQDREAALLMGIDVNKMYLIAFGMGAACLGFAGCLLLPVYYVFPSVGAYFGITSFVVVVLGGMGNMKGAFLGGLLIGIVESFSGVYLDSTLKEVVYFILFILVLLFKPNGLFGIRES